MANDAIKITDTWVANEALICKVSFKGWQPCHDSLLGHNVKEMQRLQRATPWGWQKTEHIQYIFIDGSLLSFYDNIKFLKTAL